MEEEIVNKIGNYRAEGVTAELLLDASRYTPGGFLIYADDGKKEKILFANDVLIDLVGCASVEEFIEFTKGDFKNVIHPQDHDLVDENIKEQLAIHPPLDHINYRIVTKDGKIKFVEDFSRFHVHPKYGKVYFVVIADSLEQYDPLTGLLTMNHFFERTNRVIDDYFKTNKTAAMVALNFNGLKRFNTEHGIAEGDKLLIEFAIILRSHFKNSNCSRFGEDSFYVFTSDEGLEDTLKEIFEEVKNINNGVSLSVRAGIYYYSKKEDTASACDKARSICDSKRNVYDSQYLVYDDAMLRKDTIRAYVIDNIDKALTKGYIQVYYQPQVIASDGTLQGFEALARWFDPDMGFISPGDFVPVLEEYSITYKLDLYVMEQVAKDIVKMQDLGRDLYPISINLSRSDFIMCDPFNALESIIKKYQVSRSSIHIEITESTVMSAPELIKAQIAKFRKHGYKVLMDDFGSAYSSLSTLRDLEFDVIKIDMGFMRNFGERSKMILRPVMSMARGLGIHTLCEGVETKEQLEFLQNVGCEFIQGFYFGQGEPLDKVLMTVDRLAEKYNEKVNKNIEARGDALVSFKLKKDEDEEQRIIDAIASSYNSIYIIDVKEDTYREIRANYALNKFLGYQGQVSLSVPLVMRALSSSEYIDSVLKFIDISTLSERMKDVDFIDMDFIGVLSGWINQAFFALDRDMNGNVVRALHTTRVVDASRKAEFEYKNFLKGLSNVYHAIIQVDLRSEEMTPLTLPKYMIERLGSDPQPYLPAQKMFIDNYVKDIFKGVAAQFLELDTIQARLEKKSYIGMDYLDTNDRKRRIIISPTQTDERDRIRSVIIAMEDVNYDNDK